MRRKFARIVESEECGQILLRVSYNSDENKTELIVTGQSTNNGAEANLAMGFEDEDKAFKKLEELKDEEVIEMMWGTLSLLG